tara:strand:- start:232 stop:363 length:132 start_codon:yes stop_codon:yes gene_type:complete
MCKLIEIIEGINKMVLIMLIILGLIGFCKIAPYIINEANKNNE